MTNAQSVVFNINQQTQGPRALAAQSRNRGIAPNLPENSIISAIIAQKNAGGTQLQLENGENLHIRRGEVAGEVGDAVFFEVHSNSQDGATALRQVFPERYQQNFLTQMHSVQSMQELMAYKEFGAVAESPLDAAALADARAELAQKARAAAAKLSRSIDRISGNVRGAAVAELAAAGVNIDKLPITLLDDVTSQLDAAVAQNAQKITQELHSKLDSIMDIDEPQIARMLKNGAALTLDNLYMYKHSGGAVAETLPEADWQSLRDDVARFFAREGIDDGAENMARARFLLDNGIDLNADNFNRLIFLSDIDGNVDLQALADKAVALDYDAKNLGGLEIYEPQGQDEMKDVDFKLQLAETRLAMSYEANLPLINTELEIDLDPQIEALKHLREMKGELLAALRAFKADSPANLRAMEDIFKSVFTLPFISFADFGGIAQNHVDFTPQGLENAICAHAYQANATVASLKYGDAFSKIAEQFAPLLRAMGLADDAHSIRAAKILSANNMDINEENLNYIKSVNAKISDVATRLHPRMAAQMIADGLQPAQMHMDEILAHVDRYNDQFGTNEKDMLYRHIAEMDKKGDIPEALREKVIEIYQMLHKISKNNGAGVGFAVNAGIELTLQNLMDFSKNFVASTRSGAVNYAVDDGIYYAKHLVTSFISAAKPRPLSRFVQTEPLNEPLATSVEKIEDIAQQMRKTGEISSELDVEMINQAIEEMSATGKENIRFLVSLGLPATLANIRQLKTYRERKLDEDLEALSETELAAVVSGLQDSALADFARGITPAAQNAAIASQVEQAAEEAKDAGKITKLDILMQNLNFRQMMLTNTADMSFAMKFNGRIADVAMYVINENMSVDDDGGVTLFMSLKTAMGDVQGLVNLAGKTAHIRLASGDDAKKMLIQNKEYLEDTMKSLGYEHMDISFTDIAAMKKQLSVHPNLPI